MKAQYLSVPRQSKTSRANDLATSDGHSSRMALRYELIIFFRYDSSFMEAYYFLYLANLLLLFWNATLIVSPTKNPKKRMMI